MSPDSGHESLGEVCRYRLDPASCTCKLWPQARPAHPPPCRRRHTLSSLSRGPLRWSYTRVPWPRRSRRCLCVEPFEVGAAVLANKFSLENVLHHVPRQIYLLGHTRRAYPAQIQHIPSHTVGVPLLASDKVDVLLLYRSAVLAHQSPHRHLKYYQT